MEEFFRQVCDLQRFWNSEVTDEMSRRGKILSAGIEPTIKKWGSELAKAIQIPFADFGVKASNGLTKNARVPWARIHSEKVSPTATVGWYVVYLFDVPGRRIHLSLNQGTNNWDGPSLRGRSQTELAARVRWARPVVAKAAAGRPDLVETIDLQGGRQKLAVGYERGNVLAITYERDNLPPSDVLYRDLLFMAGLLGLVYRAETAMPFIPGDIAPEIVAAEKEAAKTTERKPVKKAAGQGFGVLTSDDRKALEGHAVAMAARYYEKRGWHVQDVGLKEPFDLLMTRDGETLRAEVKGTTSHGAQVVLTRREVEKQREFAPANALVIVHSIELVRGPGKPVADGGTLVCVAPWEIAEEDLTVVSYIYRTGL
ncbi:MrcB family domain-containing protein [Embleya sp. MST-111070]|uniref:MrcB family domain-containing protein n=1 Tax=Embleya sp. MST-111070 TaxID=3398231 RepID=UPI003F7360A8